MPFSEMDDHSIDVKELATHQTFLNISGFWPTMSNSHNYSKDLIYITNYTCLNKNVNQMTLLLWNFLCVKWAPLISIISLNSTSPIP